MARAGEDLDIWLSPFLAAFGHRKRRGWAPLYLRGLLGPSERKSLQPMATSLGLSGHDQLQHFIASPAWDDAPLWRVLAEQADRLVGGPRAVLVIDDTALPKKGTLSVGVARQYCGQLGKRASCQALVSLTLAGAEVPVPVGLRLFLPEEWTADPERCAAAGVPEAEVVARSKGEIALAELDRLIATGLRFGIALADAGYGANAAFRAALSERGLTWAVGIPRNQKVYDAAVTLVPPGGRKRRPVPDQEPSEAEAVLAGLSWRRVTWRQGTKGPLVARFAATRIRVGDGPVWANNRHLPGEEVWLVGEWRTSGERKYYLSNLPPRTSLRTLAAAIKARWVCEQAHQQLKQELGLGHFEGRSWTGLRRHALMTCIAFTYLQHLRLAGQRPAGSGKNAGSGSRTATIAEPDRQRCAAASTGRARAGVPGRDPSFGMGADARHVGRHGGIPGARPHGRLPWSRRHASSVSGEDRVVAGDEAARSRMWRKARTIMAASALASALSSPGGAETAPRAATKIRHFPTPEAAVQALVGAIQEPRLAALEAVLGRAVLDDIPPGERQQAAVRRAAGAKLAAERFQIRHLDGEDRRAVAEFGDAHAQLPAVLRKSSRGWAFDQAATMQAMRERRIGVNEANAIRALHALAAAQQRFRTSDRSGDGTLCYAARIRSSPGRRDGLVVGDGDPVPGPTSSLLNDAFAAAEAPRGQRMPDPPGGYVYRILSAQGQNAEGGAKSYLTHDRLTEGFAVIAWPAQPGTSGLSTFIMNQAGTIYEREFGAGTAGEVARITTFDPAPGWTRVSDEKG